MTIRHKTIARSIQHGSNFAGPLLLLAMLTRCVGSQADTCSESLQTPVATTVTATTTIGVSLVQAVSMNRRVDATRIMETQLEHGVKATELKDSLRDEESSSTGPKGTRNFDLAIASDSDTGTDAVATSDDSATEDAQMRPTADQPLSAAEPSSETGTKTEVRNAGDVWQTWRKIRKHMAQILLPPTFLQEGAERIRQNIQQRVSDSGLSLSRGHGSALVVIVILLCLVSCVYYKVTRPEPVNSKLAWNQSPTLAPRYSTQSRSPGTNMSVGPARHLETQAGTGNFGNASLAVSTTGVASSSEDETNAAARLSSADAGFCPDLVVPQQCECILVVPVFAPVGQFSISDMHGRAVLHAFTQLQGQGLLWQLHLQTASGESLARCVEVRSHTGANAGKLEFHILDAKGKYFAALSQVQGQQRFELTTQTGFKLHFYGNFQTQAVNVTDEDDALLATTEPCGVDFDQTGIYYRLRVAPLANVGHSLCALLCIGQILRPK